MNTTTTTPALAVGSIVRIEKGCRALRINKGVSAIVTEVTPLGADYGHFVQVKLRFRNGFRAGETTSLLARHTNRLSDAVVGLHDGNPFNKIEVVRRG